MGFELTGKYVSATYHNLVQHVSDNYYDGDGNLLSIYDSSSISIALTNYISDVSLSNDFSWNSGFLEVSIKGVTDAATISYVDASLNEKIPYSVAKVTHFSTGFANRTDSSLNFDNSTLVFTIHSGINGYDVYSDASKYHIINDISIGITDVIGMHFIYYDSSCTIQHSTSHWKIDSNNSPIATVYWNGSEGALNEERHGAGRNVAWHEWAHDTIGARYESGLLGTFDSVSTNITAGYIHDEDIDYFISQQTHMRTWYRNGSVMYFDPSISNVTARVRGTTLYYDNDGTLAPVSNNNYVTNWLYASTDVSIPLMLVVGQQQNNLISNARTAPIPTFPNIITPELRLLYRVIWRNNAGKPTYIENADYRTVTSLPGGSVTSINAASVTSTAYGDISATNVQSALNELSDEKAALTYVNASLNTKVSSKNIGIVLDGQYNTISTGSKGYKEIDNNYEITGWTLLSDVSGNISIDLKVSNFDNWPTTTSITGSSCPALINNFKNSSTLLTDWVVNVSTKDIMEFYVNSDASLLTKVWLYLTLIPR